MKNKPTLRRTQRWTSLALVGAAIILLVIVVSMVLVSLTYHELVLGGRWALHSEWLRSADVQARAAALGQLGDYFGGTLGPILTSCSFLLLLVTVGHHTVAWCWQACVPMVEHQRTQLQQPGFGRFFEELDALARLCKPVVVAERLGYNVVVSEDGATVVVPNADGGSK